MPCNTSPAGPKPGRAVSSRACVCTTQETQRSEAECSSAGDTSPCHDPEKNLLAKAPQEWTLLQAESLRPQKQRTAFSSHTHSSTEGQETPKSVDSQDTSPHPHLCPVEREPQEVQGRMGNLLLLPDQSNGPQTHKLWTTVRKPEAEALSEEVRGTGCGVL